MKKNQSRTLHLIDLENLSGCGSCTAALTADIHRAYMAVVPTSPYDHYIVATSHRNFTATATWPGGFRVVGSGQDGAETALCAHALELDVPAHYDHLVVASGDHYFAEHVYAWKGAGLAVTVVSRERQISYALYTAATRFVTMPNPTMNSQH